MAIGSETRLVWTQKDEAQWKELQDRRQRIYTAARDRLATALMAAMADENFSLSALQLDGVLDLLIKNAPSMRALLTPFDEGAMS